MEMMCFLPRRSLSIGAYETAAIEPVGWSKYALFHGARTVIATIISILIGSNFWQEISNPFEATIIAVISVPIINSVSASIMRAYTRAIFWKRRTDAVVKDFVRLELDPNIAAKISS
jgi:hypothetical protein